MLEKMTERLNFHGNALLLRAERQRVIASNIANADTPGFVARDFKFGDALREATGTGASVAKLAMNGSAGTAGTVESMASTTNARHLSLTSSASTANMDRKGPLGYSVQTQPSLDNNTVDLDRERANFVDNAVRYEATLRFINGNAKTMLSAIQGQ
jgi:flagellar basal-body rod protein FlgB